MHDTTQCKGGIILRSEDTARAKAQFLAQRFNSEYEYEKCEYCTKETGDEIWHVRDTWHNKYKGTAS